MNDTSKLAKPIRSFNSLIRPKFSPGLLLQDDDLTAAVGYTRNLSRLLFRTLFGCGVLCGLQVGRPQKDNCGNLVTDVASGVALSCKGDPIEVAASRVKIDTCENDLPCFLWFAVRHIECTSVPRTPQCSPDDEDSQPTATRERDGFELRVFDERPPCSCGCKRLEPPAEASVSVSLSTAASSKQTKPLQKKAQRTAAADMQAIEHHASTSGSASSDCVYPETLETAPDPSEDPCHCNLRTGENSCYESFYKGECPCDCCDCEWIVLAVAARQDAEGNDWIIDHSVRRFVRPVLMRDWLVEQERKAATTGP
jgi:hypothetical protein